MPLLYRWEPGLDEVVITQKARSFLTDQALALELVANFYWAEFLENCNRLAPRIVQKVSRDGASRKSLQKYLKILLADPQPRCFYCESPLGDRVAPTVDHVIPWSFLLEDDLWDLVPACAKCNAGQVGLASIRNFHTKTITAEPSAFSGRYIPSNQRVGGRAALPSRDLGRMASVLVRMKKYDKLVRDGIPTIIEEAGKRAIWRELSDEEFREALKAKVLEEAGELLEASDGSLLSELATCPKS
jgi:hypothetical protein